MTVSSRGLETSAPTTAWSLGAVLAEREMDEDTILLLCRADAGITATLALRWRLTQLALGGYRTLIVDLGDAHEVGDTTIAVLVGTRRIVEQHGAQLVVAAEQPSVEEVITRAGLELAGPLAED